MNAKGTKKKRKKKKAGEPQSDVGEEENGMIFDDLVRMAQVHSLTSQTNHTEY